MTPHTDTYKIEQSADQKATDACTLATWCDECHKTFHFQVSVFQLQAWQRGQLIQNCLPQLTESEREVLITNTCGACFDKLFEGLEDA